MGVTWNNQPSLAKSYGSVDIMANNSWRYVSLNITSLVQGWVNGSYPNYGVMCAVLKFQELIPPGVSFILVKATMHLNW